MRWDQYYDVPYLDTLKVWWSRYLTIIIEDAFFPPALKQYIHEWLWTCQKISPVLPHIVSAAGNDRAIHFVRQHLQTRGGGTFQLGSGAACYTPSSFQQKSTCVLCLSILELHLEWKTTFLWKDMIKKIQQTFWNEEKEACAGNIWRLFSCFSLISSTNRFRSQLPLLGPTRTLFKTH